MLNNNAHQNPSILIPSTSLAAIKITNALITNKNNPNVIIVAGSVSITNIGFTIASNNANANANINAVSNPSICTPDKIFDNKKVNAADATIFNKNFIQKYYNFV